MRRGALLAGALCGCSLVNNADDVVVGNGLADSEVVDSTALDSGAIDGAGDGLLGEASVDAPLDAPSDAVDATVAEDRRWALWPIPATTPTSYDGAASGVVRDAVTGLRWQRDPMPKATLADASAACAAISLGGTTGWRLPFRVELVSLLAISDLNVPTIHHTFFPGTPSAKHWTASSRPKGGIYVVDFSNATVGTALDTDTLDFRCVHSP